MKKIIALLLITVALPIMAARVKYLCVAVRATAWIAFKNTHLADFNNARGNKDGIDSLLYFTVTNVAGAVFYCFTFNQDLMQHGSNVWNGAYMTGMANAFNNPAGRMIAAGDIENASEWFVDNGFF